MVKYIIICAIGLSAFSASAQYRINTDVQSIAQVGKNLAYQKSIEELHNSLLDSVRNNQEQTALRSSFMASSKQLSLQTKRNAKDFDTESTYYKLVRNLSLDIAKIAPEVVGKIKKSKLSGKAMMLMEVSGLIDSSVQIAHDFRNIVFNKPSPSFEVSYNLSSEGKVENDGTNILDRDERLNLALSLINNLDKIKTKLLRLNYSLEYANWGNVLFQIDRETWADLKYTKNLSNSLAEEWKSLSK